MFNSSSAISRSALWRLLAAIFFSRMLFALLVWRLAGVQGFYSPDTPSYVAPAESLLHGSFSTNGIPEIIRTPGYPLLLAPAVATRHPVVVALLENFVLALGAAWLVWKIAIELGLSNRAGWWAAFLYGLEPVGLVSSQKLLSDLCFNTLLLIFIWLAVRFLRTSSYNRLVVAALVLVVATYTRPVSLFLGLALVPFFLFFPRQSSWVERFPRAFVFGLVFAVALAPWIIRNAAVAGYHGFSAITDVNLYISAAAVEARLEHKPFLQVQQEFGETNSELYFRNRPEQRDWTQAQVLQSQAAQARQILAQHWSLYVAVHLRGCAVVIFDPAVTDIMKLLHLYPESGGLLYRSADQGPVSATIWLLRHYPAVGIALPLLGAQLLLYYILGFVGLRRLPLDARAFFIFVFAYFVLVSGSAYAVSRYRGPVMPLICIAAGAAIASWGKARTAPLSRHIVGENAAL